MSAAPGTAAPASAPGAGTRPDEGFPFWRRNMIVLTAGTFLYSAGFTIFYPYVSLIVREFGITEIERYFPEFQETISREGE